MATNDVWTITRILTWTRQYFAGKGIENPRLDAELLLCEVLHCERITLYVHFDQPLQESELARYRDFIIRRGKQEPLAYILGHKEFYKYDFKVTPAVLVPRPETELLVEKVAQAPMPAEPRILDVGTGSGAILISLLAELPQAAGVGVDKSAAALAVAKANAAYVATQVKDATLPARFTWTESDVLTALPATERFDVLVSNPPYIPSGVIPTLARDVQREPHLALDGGQDGLSIYRRLLAEAPAYLQPDSLVALEIGEEQGGAVAALAAAAGFTVQVVLQDYANLDRMVLATKEGSSYADYILGLKK
ncbi:MAG: peptide chain release factor N(5)-glutamine methyltransferase [Acidaminococcaceae bacterium]|jgi:release factor glutamine methyltransferase|nr:peptide chain release factor N(5)-glutamine methyltransferase [Acidaminococcaceae bacterium]